MKRIGFSPWFVVPGCSKADGLAKRLVKSTKSLSVKVAVIADTQQWCQVRLAAWRDEVPRGTMRVPTALFVLGQVIRAPLASVHTKWCWEVEFPFGSGKGPPEYLRGARENLRIAIRFLNWSRVSAVL